MRRGLFCIDTNNKIALRLENSFWLQKSQMLVAVSIRYLDKFVYCRYYSKGLKPLEGNTIFQSTLIYSKGFQLLEWKDS